MLARQGPDLGRQWARFHFVSYQVVIGMGSTSKALGDEKPGRLSAFTAFWPAHAIFGCASVHSFQIGMQGSPARGPEVSRAK